LTAGLAAAALAVERLEPRTLLASPTLNVSGGPATLVEGNPYTLSLSSSSALSQWDVD
jgi:hypothetical protein